MAQDFTQRVLYRILDANLDRSREGLRVIEEWCRFGLENAELSNQCKQLRQALAIWHVDEFRQARDTPADVGTTLSHANEETRSSIPAVLRANFGRLQEAMRVLEEYGKVYNPEMGAACKQMRYQVYTLESQILTSDKTARTFLVSKLPHPSPPLALAAKRLPEGYGREQDSSLPPLQGGTKGGKSDLCLKDNILNESVNLMSNSRHDRLQKLHAANLYLVTMPSDRLLETVESAVRGGVKIVQYRQKEGNDQERLAIAEKLCQICHKHEALFLVNDRVDVAMAVGADGVHLGQQDMPVAIARQILGEAFIIGMSTTNPEELAIAIAANPDYVGVGPVYATPTKPGKAAAGFEYVRYAAEKLNGALGMPWYAIGGINAENLAEVVDAGASRVAVVRSLMQAPNPELVATQMISILTGLPL